MNRRRRTGGARVSASAERAARSLLVLGVSFVLLVGCGGVSSTSHGASTPAGASQADGPRSVPADCGAPKEPTRLVPEVLGERPHDPTAFTEGLLLADGLLYESTGLEGASSVRAVDPATGAVLRRSELDPASFGEGLTTLGSDRLIQLTWKEGRAFIWNRSDLRAVGGFRYRGEGWGITTLDDGRLVMSDGSDRLTIRDPGDFAVLERWTVTRSDGAADMLNELEWDGANLWANRWRTDEMVRIDLRCRRVDAVVDATELRKRAADVAGVRPIDVLNGIAHVAGTDRFLVTGKNWPLMFEVRMGPVEPGGSR